jgi:hypothetical protein
VDAQADLTTAGAASEAGLLVTIAGKVVVARALAVPQLD